MSLSFLGMLSLLLALMSLGIVRSVVAQQFGTISGMVTDSQTKEALVGATAVVVGTQLGAFCDVDGRFSIRQVPVGVHIVRFSTIGYKTIVWDSVVVTSRGVATIDAQLESETIQYTNETITVEVRKVENTDAALLTDRRKAAGVTNAISAEMISRNGSSDAAGAMTHVTGVTIADGKHIIVRGLGDRYTNSSLNGMALPSADPDRQSAPLDLISAGMLDNIVVLKTFTPDQPGNFTGGSVELNLKKYPEQGAFSFGTSSSYNSQASFSDKFLSYSGGSTDWLGIDDGGRDIPALVSRQGSDIPSVGSAFVNPDSSIALDKASRAFNTQMSPTVGSAPTNQSYTLNYGNKYSIGNRPLGMMASLNYKRNISFYENGKVGRWNNPGNVNTVNELSKDYLLNDTKSTDEVSWGGLVSLTHSLGVDQSVRANLMYNRSAETSSRYLFGELPRDLGEDEVFETRALGYTERQLSSFQAKGTHKFDFVKRVELDWQAGFANTQQNNPDLRFFSDDYRYIARRDTTVYSISPSKYPSPTHYFRNLDENTRDLKVNLVMPFTRNDIRGEVKFGVAALSKSRTFREKQYDYKSLGSSWGYTGDPNSYFANNVGNSNVNSSWSGLYVSDVTDLRNSYNGDQTILGTYAMLSYPISRKVTVITGARFETTKMTTLSLDPTEDVGSLSENDILPSLNVVYKTSQYINIRAAYGRTLARPTLREMAPFPSFEFINDYILSGNPNLQRTLVDNYDLRWEWFARPGEVMAVSVYLKNFSNPIERTIVDANGSVQFVNVESGQVYGLEFELRKRLDQLGSRFSNVFIAGNLTLVDSKVDIGETELTIIRAFDPNASSTRPMQGQSGYILNAELTYENAQRGTVISGMFNVFGERLATVSLGGTPDVYEQPRPEFDLTFSQRLLGSLKLKAAGKNILNSKYKKTHQYKGQEYIFQEYSSGSTFSLGLTYSP